MIISLPLLLRTTRPLSVSFLHPSSPPMIIPESEWDRAAAVPGAGDPTCTTDAPPLSPNVSPNSPGLLSPGQPPRYPLSCPAICSLFCSSPICSYHDSVDRSSSRLRSPSRRPRPEASSSDRPHSRLPSSTAVLEGGTEYAIHSLDTPVPMLMIRLQLSTFRSYRSHHLYLHSAISQLHGSHVSASRYSSLSYIHTYECLYTLLSHHYRSKR